MLSNQSFRRLYYVLLYKPSLLSSGPWSTGPAARKTRCSPGEGRLVGGPSEHPPGEPALKSACGRVRVPQGRGLETTGHCSDSGPQGFLPHTQLRAVWAHRSAGQPPDEPPDIAGGGEAHRPSAVANLQAHAEPPALHRHLSSYVVQKAGASKLCSLPSDP